MEEIARISGVSKATVSRVLNNAPGVGVETRKIVQEVIDRMNYSHVSTQFPMRSRSIALVVPDISNPFFAHIAHAVETRAHLDDSIVILSNTDTSEEKELEYISNLIAKKVDGIILVPCGSKCRKGHLLPEKYGIPMVLLDRKLEGPTSFLGVYSDNEYAAFRSCEVMIEHGAKRIAYISGPMGVSTAVERFNGYKLALEQYGIPFKDDLVRMGNYTVESGYNAIIEMEKAGTKYEAILAANDMMALGALNALKEFSYKIPEDVELIGFDNINFAHYCDPPLSTIQQPTTEMGERSTDMLLQLINRKKVGHSIHLQPKLLLRKTTK